MAWMTYISHWFDEDDWYEGQQRTKMSQVKQVGLLAAGCQPWNKDVCAASGDRFAYCATLAIYVYQLDHRYNEFKLQAIMSEHKKTITAISWCPHNPDMFASASADSLVVVWNVTEQKVVAKLDNTKGIPASLSWCWNAGDAVAFVSHRGPLYIWTISGPDSGVTVHREAHSFLSDISLFRWHPKKKGKVVFGHTDGSLSIFQPGSKNQKHVLRPESLEGTDEEDPVTALEWDPLSTDYLLVANLHNGIRLVDSESLSCITTFNFPSAAASVQCLAWVSSAPGMFITGDSQIGVLRVWNVSRTTPIDNFKLKKTGFHGLHVLSSPPKKKSCSSQYPTKNHHTSSTSEAVPPPTLTHNQAFSLPPGHAVCCFMDGGVGLYDMGAKKWDFLRDLGHVETIFDCKFKPDNPDLLATASFDGTIKVWDINTLTAVYTSPGNEGVIYSLSWAPGDLNCIAGATSRNGGFIWDVPKGKMITRFSEHGKNGIFCIAWSHKDSKRIATCSSDGFCIIRTIDGKVLHKYKHPAAVFGCDWSQNNKDMIATGCEDKNVRVYYLATSSDQPLKVFTGHTAKVFHVRWSPLREGILCSGSDDGTVRIWDYTQDACINVLSGHTAPVRGLMWNPEIPYLLISGSWDYTIRVWDTRDGTCLDTVYDHGADVYGLTCHPSRPFTMASCSRDSTVRLWSLTPLINPLQINILADRCWDEIIGNTDRAVESGAPPLLCGKVSRDIKQEVEKLTGNPRGKKLRWFSECFSPPGGSKNLWDLVAVIKGQDDSLLPQHYCKGIMHMKHLIRFRMVKWFGLEETLKIIWFQPPCHGQGHLPLDQVLKALSNLALNTAREGAATASLGNLCQCLTTVTVKNFFLISNLDLISFSLKLLPLVLSLLLLIKGPSPSFLALCHASLPSSSLKRPKSALLNSRVASLLCTLLDVLRILNSISWSLQPRLPLSFTFPASPSLLVRTRSSIAPLLIGSAITWRRKLSSTHSRNLLDCLCPAVLSLPQAYIQYFSVPSSEYNHVCLVFLSALVTMLLSSLTNFHFSSTIWDCQILLELSPDLLASKASSKMSLISYQLLKRREVSVPLKIEQLSEELEAWRACTQLNKPTDELPCTPPSESQRTVYSTLVSRIQEEPLKGMVGPDYVTGSNLPSHSDVHISCLTGLRIQGPVFFLEDGKSAISLNDALMWAKVNPFSPLGTGIRLNPF
ncbi:unnamed protein product [Bubo scandiacus]